MSHDLITITVTISRAHCGAKRLHDHAGDCYLKVRKALATFRVAEKAALSGEAAQRSAAQREEALALMAESLECELAAAQIRAEIGAANVRQGTAARMARDVALNTFSRRLSGLLEEGGGVLAPTRSSSYDTPTVVYSDELPFEPAVAEDKSERPSYVVMTPYNRALLGQFEAQLEALKYERMHAADDNSDANRATISLRLPERLAKYAGLYRPE